MQQNIQLHSALISPDHPGFNLIFSCLKMKLFRTFLGFYPDHFKDSFETIVYWKSQKLTSQIPLKNIHNWFLIQAPENLADN